MKENKKKVKKFFIEDHEDLIMLVLAIMVEVPCIFMLLVWWGVIFDNPNIVWEWIAMIP